MFAGALTWGRIGLLAPVLAAVPNNLDNIAPSALDRTIPHDPTLIALVVAGVLGAIWIVSIAAAIVSFAGFRVWRDSTRLRIERGAFQRRAASIAVERVVGVRLVEGVLRQPFGLAMLRVEVAGFADDKADTQMLCPVIRGRDAERVVVRLLPEFAGAFAPNEPTINGSFGLAAFAPVAAAIAVALALNIAFGVVGVPAWGLVLVALLLARGRSRAAGMDLTNDRLTLRFRRLARTTLITRVRMVQHIQTAASVPQRWLRRATVIVGTGSGRRFHVHDLPADHVQRVVDAIGRQVTRRPARRTTPTATRPTPVVRT